MSPFIFFLGLAASEHFDKKNFFCFVNDVPFQTFIMTLSVFKQGCVLVSPSRRLVVSFFSADNDRSFLRLFIYFLYLAFHFHECHVSVCLLCLPMPLLPLPRSKVGGEGGGTRRKQELKPSCQNLFLQSLSLSLTSETLILMGLTFTSFGDKQLGIFLNLNCPFMSRTQCLNRTTHEHILNSKFILRTQT